MTSDPDHAPGRQITVVEAVAEGVERVRAVESDSLRAYLLRVLGDVYIRQGQPVHADTLLREALAIHGDAVSAEASRVRQQLILTRDALSDPDGVIVLARQLTRDNPDDPDVAMRVASAESRAFADLGRHGEAVSSALRGVDAAVVLGTSAARARAAARLGDALTGAGRYLEAVAQHRTAVRLIEAEYGREHASTAYAWMGLGYALGHAGDIDGAEAYLGRALAFMTERYGADRPGYLIATIGEVNLIAGRPRRAAMLLDSAASMVSKILEPDHIDLAQWNLLEAEARVMLGEYRRAEARARAALAAARLDRPATPVWMEPRAQGWLGLALAGQGRAEPAAPLLRSASADLRARRDAWTARDSALARSLRAVGVPAAPVRPRSAGVPRSAEVR